MDFDGSRYYRITRIYLTYLGLWPYCSKRAKCIPCVLLSPLLFSALISLLSSFITKKFSAELVLDILSYSGVTTYYMLKYFGFFFQSDKIKNLMEQVQCDWNSLQNEKEQKIIHRHSNIIKYILVISIVCIYTMMCLLTLAFLWPNILNIVIPLNESRRTRHFPLAMEYFIDQEKHIYFLTFYSFLVSFVAVNIIIGTESLNLLYIQHACAMFEITGYRIECIVKRNETKLSNLSGKSNSSCKSFVQVIDSHQRAIKFIHNIKSTFGTIFLLATPVGVLSLSVNLYQLCKYIRTRDIGIISLSFLYVITHFVCIFLANYVSQRIIDHNNDVFKTICNTRWYATPVHIQKCILVIMCRSMKISTFVIGYVFVPSLKGYATLISKSLSYSMVIYSTYGRFTYQTCDYCEVP
ncbi:Or9e79 [Eciton burchellii]|nr:Or9e79 [Eciton burchellii]